jgi:N-acetylglucosaminyldiphosphoundecaprenol N-acetyl-beta-D-mannosaminyltransferase
VLGVEYFVGDLRSATATVLRRVSAGRGGYSCLCGVHGIVTAQHSDAMMDALGEAWLNFPD